MHFFACMDTLFEFLIFTGVKILLHVTKGKIFLRQWYVRRTISMLHQMLNKVSIQLCGIMFIDQIR